MSKPVVFVGSSSEGKEIAHAIVDNLYEDAEMVPWFESDIFRIGQNTLESLVNAADTFDYAILVFTADDAVESRGIPFLSPRDNVLFELGLFMGKLGRTRTFIVYNPDEGLKIPSDLAGVTHAIYRNFTVGPLKAALSSACNQIRSAIKEQGSLEREEESALRLLGIKHLYRDQSGVDLLRIVQETRPGSEIKMLGITIRALNLHTVRRAIIEKLEENCRVKILLIDRNSEFAKKRAMQENREFDDWSKELIHYDDLHQSFVNEQVPRELTHKEKSHNISLQHYDVLPACSVVMNDQTMFVGYYPLGKGGVFSPHLELDVKENGLCVPFERYFDSVWRND